VAVGLFAVYAPGLWRRIPILIGAVVGYLVYYIAANVMGLGPAIDFSKIGAAAWTGMPNFSAPVFDSRAMFLIAPVAIVLVAGNFKLSLGGFTLDGIGTATFGCIILYHLLNAGRREDVV